jgi:dethiobiotin synthetase
MRRNQDLVVAGISTEVGKTVVSAILVEALKADYWKPVQSGSETDSDLRSVREMVSNDSSVFHPEAYTLTKPLSPHAAADIDGVEVDIDQIILPKTNNRLVVELAGGLHVPLNHELTNMDLLTIWKMPVVLVANYYLGSINHTLLSIESLVNNRIPIHSIVFNGPTVESTRDVILNMTGIKRYFELPTLDNVDKEHIKQHALRFAKTL